MMLSAWPQVGDSATDLRIWVGLFGLTQPPPAPGAAWPPPPVVVFAGHQAKLLGEPAWQAIRDGRAIDFGGRSKPLNYQCLLPLSDTQPGQVYELSISVPGLPVKPEQLRVQALPAQIPRTLDGSFNLLLSSCYYQPFDGDGLLGSVISKLPQTPHMTLLAGDQIYADLPLSEDLPEDADGLARALGDKYWRNWLSDDLGIAGLQSVLTQAPTVCIPDDHEYWNNYPFFQVQLPGTWTEQRRQCWSSAAQALYEDFQCGGAHSSAPLFRRIDIHPLSMLLLDSRSLRSAQAKAPAAAGGAACGPATQLEQRPAGQLFDDAAKLALKAWCQHLLDALNTGQPQVGLLCTGQALFIPKPSDWDSHVADAELANYAQFDEIEQALDDLTAAGVPVVFVTGDVHWSRVTSARRGVGNRALLHEVICSPARLIPDPRGDSAGAVKDGFLRLFGKGQTWPRHAEPAPVPPRFGAKNQFSPQALPFAEGRGDHVALLRFTRVGAGLELRVQYHAIHKDPAVARPVVVGPITLLPGG